MRGPDPKALIIHDLTRPFDSSARDEAIKEAPLGQYFVAYIGGDEQRGANPASIHFHKERELGGHHVYGVSWRSADGRVWQATYAALRRADGRWDVYGGGGGSGDDPRRGRPWVNLSCGGRPLHFGGRVCEAPQASRVRVVYGEHTLEDDVDETRWVLFPTNLPNELMQEEWVVEIYAPGDDLIARHRALGRSEPL